MKKILVPVDFSEQAEYALEVAAQIAKATDARIKLLHTIDMMILQSDAPSQVVNFMEISKALQQDANRKMDKWLSKEILSGLEVESEIKLSNTFHSIIGEVEDKKVELIVMGTKGASGFKEFALGSNAEKVVRWAEVPVLTIKERNLKFSIREVLFVSNFNHETNETLEKVKNFLAPFNAKIHLLKVITPTNFEPTNQTIKVMENFADVAKLNNFSINVFNDINLEEGIRHFNEMLNADIVILPTHGRTGISHFIYGSKAENTVNHVTAPIITFKIEEKEHEYHLVLPEMR